MAKKRNTTSRKGLMNKRLVSKKVKRRTSRGGKVGRKSVRRKSVRRKSVRRKSVRRKPIQVGGGNAAHYEELKTLASKILNETSGYDESYIVGSLAIALHEENADIVVSEFPNDIDIVIPVNGIIGKAPDISGMTSTNQTATSGVTFHDSVNHLSVDVIQEKMRKSSRPSNTVDINGLRVLDVASLIYRYKGITTGWESGKEAKQTAQKKIGPFECTAECFPSN